MWGCRAKKLSSEDANEYTSLRKDEGVGTVGATVGPYLGRGRVINGDEDYSVRSKGNLPLNKCT